MVKFRRFGSMAPCHPVERRRSSLAHAYPNVYAPKTRSSGPYIVFEHCDLTDDLLGRFMRSIGFIRKFDLLSLSSKNGVLFDRRGNVIVDKGDEGLDRLTLWKAGSSLDFIAFGARHSALLELDQSAA